MENWIETFAGFLIISSALLLALGVLGCLVLTVFKIRGKPRLLVCSMLIVMPAIYPMGSLIPDRHRIPLPAEKLQAIFPAALESGITTFTYDRGRSAGSYGTPVATAPPAAILSPGTQPVGPDLHGTTSLALTWKQALTVTWICLFVFILMRSFFFLRKTRRLIKYADPVTNPAIVKILKKCQNETGLRRSPSLRVIHHTLTPMAVGILRPTVILPARLLRPELREGLRFTLLHELKHLKRRDNCWLLFESMVGAVYFFHPVIYWAKRRIHEEWEYICDHHVVQVTKKPASYADFLLHEIWNHGRRMTPSLAVPLIFRPRKTAKRVHFLIEKMRPTLFTKIRDRMAVGTVFVCFISVFLCTATPSAYVNQEDISHGQTDGPRFTVNDKSPAVTRGEGDPEPASIGNGAIFENGAVQKPEHEDVSGANSEPAPAVPESVPVSTATAPARQENMQAAIETEPMSDWPEMAEEISATSSGKNSAAEQVAEETSEDIGKSPSELKRDGAPESGNVAIPMGARIFDWQVIDDRNIIIMTQFYGSFKATLAKDYPELSKYRKDLTFVSNGPCELDAHSKIILPNNETCFIQTLVPHGDGKTSVDTGFLF